MNNFYGILVIVQQKWNGNQSVGSICYVKSIPFNWTVL